MNWSKYISCEHLGRKIQFLGPVPSTKEAYRTALRIAWPSATETVLVSLVSSVLLLLWLVVEGRRTGRERRKGCVRL